MGKKQRALDLALNLGLLALECAGAALSFRQSGWKMLIFYTEDSNLLSLAACAVWCFLLLRRPAAPPRWARALKYMSVCCLTVTFVVVVTVLAPLTAGGGAAGYRVMLTRGSMLFNHLLCPVLSFLTFTLLEREPPLSRRAVFAAVVPTALYAAVTTLLNALRVMEGPYPFLRVYEQPLWLSFVWAGAILGGAYLLARLIWLADGGRRRAAVRAE